MSDDSVQEGRREQGVFDDIFCELRRAETKHPGWPSDPVHAAAVVAEESGELVKAAMEYYFEDKAPSLMYNEAVETAAMAIRFLVAFGRDGYKRIEASHDNDGLLRD